MGWQGAIEDQSREVTFWGYVYDFAWSKAIAGLHERLQQEIRLGNLALERVPRRLDNILLVLTRDDRLVLGLRGRNMDEANKWMVSCGESFDPNKHGEPGEINLEKLVRQTLSDSDELGIPEQAVEKILPLGILTEWNGLMGNVAALVKLTTEMEQARKYWQESQRSEIYAIDSIPFTLQACVRLIKETKHWFDGRRENLPLVKASVIALLLALVHEFPGDQILLAIQSPQ